MYLLVRHTSEQQACQCTSAFMESLIRKVCNGLLFHLDQAFTYKTFNNSLMVPIIKNT